MCFWALNVYLLNLIYASCCEDRLENIRNIFYKEADDINKRLLREELKDEKNKEEREYIKSGVTGVTKYIIKQITKHNKIFVGGGCFEHFGQDCLDK
uniref:Uncharacterized protein n=1 Tax=Meloidogyne hapla TaxID=6305 RepID=A0A1I8B0W9_MELHA